MEGAIGVGSIDGSWGVDTCLEPCAKSDDQLGPVGVPRRLEGTRLSLLKPQDLSCVAGRVDIIRV